MPPRSSISFCSGSRSMTGIRRLGIHLGRVRALEPGDVARELRDGDVHAEADAEVRDPALARDLARDDLALPAARAEAAGDEHAVRPLELGARPPRRSSPPRRPSARARCTPWWMPACLSASCTERYASWSFTYLPTSAISTSPLAPPMRSTSASHSARSASASAGRACRRRASRGPPRAAPSGTR